MFASLIAHAMTRETQTFAHDRLYAFFSAREGKSVALSNVERSSSLNAPFSRVNGCGRVSGAEPFLEGRKRCFWLPLSWSETRGSNSFSLFACVRRAVRPNCMHGRTRCLAAPEEEDFASAILLLLVVVLLVRFPAFSRDFPRRPSVSDADETFAKARRQKTVF